MRIDWQESGGPPVKTPERPGVGHYLMKSVLSPSILRRLDISFDADGVRAVITAEI